MFNFRKILALFAAPRSEYDRALRHIAHGRPHEALAMLDELLVREQAPARRAEIVNKRGVALVAMEERDRARAAFESALEIVPEFAPALVNLGNLELEDDRSEAAIALYQRALASDENSASACRHLALAYRRAGRTAEAYRTFSRARRLEGRTGLKQRKHL